MKRTRKFYKDSHGNSYRILESNTHLIKCADCEVMLEKGERVRYYQSMKKVTHESCENPQRYIERLFGHFGIYDGKER